MGLYTAPKSFITRLKAYDPLLRVRWSDKDRRWLVERKITHGRSMDPNLFKVHQYEEFVARREGYIPVLYCQKEQLDNRVLYTLFMNDIQRHGGAQVMANKLDHQEEAYRQKSRAQWLDTAFYQAMDRARTANTLSRQKRQLESWDNG